MKYIFDLDDTLIQSTALNNDAYNYALEKFGYPRINTSKRLTREKLKFIPYEKLKEIIEEKQKYFMEEWLPYRVILNSQLIEKIKKYGKRNCYLWTKANAERAETILKCCNLKSLFNKVIYDDKVTLSSSIPMLKTVTHEKEFVIYENNHQFFDNKHIEIIEQLRTRYFDVGAYLIKT